MGIDDELQELRRALARIDTPDVRLVFARALLRAGDVQAAAEALLPARGDSRVQRELALLPA